MRGHTTHTYAEVSKHIGMCAHTQACKHMHVHTCMHVHKYMHMHACTACVEQLRSVPYPPNWFTHSATYVYCKMHIYMRTCTYAHVHIRMAPAQLPTVIWRACVPPPPPHRPGGRPYQCAILHWPLSRHHLAAQLQPYAPSCSQWCGVGRDLWGPHVCKAPGCNLSHPPTHPPTHTHTHTLLDSSTKPFGRKQEGQHCPFCGACERD